MLSKERLDGLAFGNPRDATKTPARGEASASKSYVRRTNVGVEARLRRRRPEQFASCWTSAQRLVPSARRRVAGPPPSVPRTLARVPNEEVARAHFRAVRSVRGREQLQKQLFAGFCDL